MPARSTLACLLTLTMAAVGGVASSAAGAGTGPLELLADDMDQAAFSADGTRAAFARDNQVYARDLTTGVTTLVSSVDGVAPGPVSWTNPAMEISRNGRYVTFASYARLHPLDTDGRQDVYLKDLTTGALSLVSTTSTGEKGNLDSFGPAPVSDEGSVVFASNSGNFPPVTNLPSPCWEEDSCLETEIYVKRSTGELVLLSAGSRGDFTSAVSGSIFGDISADGTRVAIGTTDPLAGDGDAFPHEPTSSFPDVFIRDLATGETVLASNEGPSAHNSFYFPSLSADGTTVAFQGTITGADPVRDQVFVRDLSQALPSLASRTPDGGLANDVAQDANLSADGGFLAFSSRATNLHPDDPDDADDIYVRDLATGELRLASQRDDGTKGTAGGSQPEVALDGGAGVIFSTFLKNFDPTVTGFGYGWYLKRLSPSAPPPPPPPADADGDGVADALQPAGTAAGAFHDGSLTPPTTGAVLDAAGLDVQVTDATDPADGVLITVGPAAEGAPRATVSACGVQLRLSPGTSAVITCGSVIVRTLAGSVEALLDGDLIRVTIPAGTGARIQDTPTGAEVDQVAGTGVTVSVNGATTTLAAGGATASFASWVASGFRAPVDNLPVVNVVKAGRAVPLKWHVQDATGAPVTTLTSATIRLQHLGCASGAPSDAIEQTVAGASGLQNLGGGDYQLNWKTSSALAGSCTRLALDLGGGVTIQADFRFTR